MNRIIFILSCALALVCASFSALAAPTKTIAMLIAEPQYQTGRTLPVFAKKYLGEDFRVVYVTGSAAAGDVSFDGIDEIAHADVLLVRVRRRTPPADQLAIIRAYVNAGKPVVGIRTASHAFRLAKGQPPAGDADWAEWDHEVLGGNYHDHYKMGPAVVIDASDRQNEILRGVALPFNSTVEFYKTSPLRPGAHIVLNGSIPGAAPEPVAWTFRRQDGGRSFYTSLGAPSDFDNASFCRLLSNGIRWASGQKIEP
jgi:type 1 glutamine amidotransferase